MRLLYALPYGPGVTRIRSRMLLTELTSRHDVTLIALAWNAEDYAALDEWRSRCTAVHAVPHALRRNLQVTADLARQPLQYVVSRSADFASIARETIATAASAGAPFDAVHIEHLRGAAAIDMLRPLGARTIFDAVDCLAELARLTRAHGPGRIARMIAGYEQSRTQRMESRLLRAADVVTVVAERDRRALLCKQALEHVLVVPNGVQTVPRAVTIADEPTAIFTGKLSYHANQAAARWLIAEIWPRVRQAVPEATLIIAGADPPEWLVRLQGKNGIHIVANPPQMSRMITAARVALAPVVYSVGIQNKVLEAMAAGVPVVASSSAVEGLLPQSLGTLAQADSAHDFALETARLLTDDRAAHRFSFAGYDYVTRHHSWQVVAKRFENLYAGALDAQQAA